MKFTSRHAAMSLAAVMGLAWAGQAARAERADSGKIIPQDAFLMVAVPSVKGSIDNFKRTGMYGLYKDPSMQEFVKPAEKKNTPRPPGRFSPMCCAI